MRRLASSALRLPMQPYVRTASRTIGGVNAAMTDEHISAFFRDGVVCVPGVVDPDQCDRLRERIAVITEEEAERRRKAQAAGEAVASANFSTVTKEQSANDYFMTSGDKVRFFLESGCDDVSLATVNKVGHALHTDGGVFQEFVGNSVFRGMLRRLGHRHPSVIQSMYIMKPPKIGGEVVPHQDSTWLATSPFSVMGVWFAIDDATVHNSCLHALKGSQFTHVPLTAKARLADGDKLETVMEGELPAVKLSEMEPLECKKGTMVLFGGQLIHASGANNSHKSRHAFVFHVVDDACSWDERNWIAPTVARLAL